MKECCEPTGRPPRRWLPLAVGVAIALVIVLASQYL